MREARERLEREALALAREADHGTRLVLHMPVTPAAPRGPGAFDESHTPGPPVLAGRTPARAASAPDGARPAQTAPTPPALPTRPAPTLAARLAAARAAGASVGPAPAMAPPAMPAPTPPPPAPRTSTAPGRHATRTSAPGAAFTRPPTRSAQSGERHGERPGGPHRPRLGRPVRWTAQGVVLAAVVASTGAFTLYHRSLTVDVDGHARSVDAYGWTVGDVLAQQHVPVKPGDVVEPATSAPARGVDEVVVRTSRQVRVEVNGQARTIHTTAATVGELLDAMGDRDAAAYDTASRSQPLGRTPIRLVTSKSVHVLVDGQDVAITTSAATVGDVLARAGVTLGSKDTTSVPRGAAAVDGMVVIVNRGRTSSATETEVVAFGSKKVDDPSLPKGQKVVEVAGHVGTVERTYSVDAAGGVEVSRRLVKQETAAKPVDEVVRVGTMDVPDPATVVVSPGSAQAIAKAMVAKRGWNSAQFSCLVSLWNRESGWRVNAANPSGAYGIPQSLPGSKMAAAGADWRTDAATQITWGLGYIADRYGTPCGAWGHSQATGFY